jgi:hypothetical protein
MQKTRDFNGDVRGVRIGDRELQTYNILRSQTEGGSQFSRTGRSIGVAFYPNSFKGVAGIEHQDKVVDHQDTDSISETSESEDDIERLKSAQPGSGRRISRGLRSWKIVLWFRCFGNRLKQSASSHGGLKYTTATRSSAGKKRQHHRRNTRGDTNTITSSSPSRQANGARNIFNEEANASRLIHQICAAIRNRLRSVPQFSYYMVQLETLKEDQYADGPVYDLRNFLRTGVPLLAIYNATGPAKPLLLDEDERFTADTNAKRAIAMFLDRCIGELEIEIENAFMIADLLSDDLLRFMKVRPGKQPRYLQYVLIKA